MRLLQGRRVVHVQVGQVPGDRSVRLLQPLRIVGGLDDHPLGGVVRGLFQDHQVVQREDMVGGVAEEHVVGILRDRCVEVGHRQRLVHFHELHGLVVPIALGADLLDVRRRPARCADPDLAPAVAVGVEVLRHVGIGQIGEPGDAGALRGGLRHAHALERGDAVRVHLHRTLGLHELVVQVGLVGQPHFGMHVHAAGVHRLEDDRVGAVLEFHLQAEVVLQHDLEDACGGRHGRPVGDADDDVGGMDGRHAGGQQSRAQGAAPGECLHRSLLAFGSVGDGRARPRYRHDRNRAGFRTVSGQRRGFPRSRTIRTLRTSGSPLLFHRRARVAAQCSHPFPGTLSRSWRVYS